ncbi:MAG: N-acetyltransferase family protein [Microthrixaceae bacterium]
MTSSPVRIRTATVADAEAIRAIYNVEVSTSTVTFDLVERSLDEQRRWILNRSGAHAVTVAIDDHGEVVGFGSLSPYRDRPAYSTSVESSVYVHRDHHRRGVGSAIVADLVDRAASHGFHALFARIVAGHTPSIELHRALGFETVGIERQVGRKFGRWLDVTVMERLLASAERPTT